MKKKMFFLLVLLICFSLQGLAKKTTASTSVFNVRAYGAKGDGVQLDSPSVNKAIEAASKAGGGTVFFPAGTYLSGS
ncbi:MAG: glycosyl hydrolase family 28-related protein, partial [Bacteroidia bacterium]|nr:glycosyl hydrolase family 28-related protein [Bacteroidia bacterium]